MPVDRKLVWGAIAGALLPLTPPAMNDVFPRHSAAYIAPATDEFSYSPAELDRFPRIMLTGKVIGTVQVLQQEWLLCEPDQQLLNVLRSIAPGKEPLIKFLLGFEDQLNLDPAFVRSVMGRQFRQLIPVLIGRDKSAPTQISYPRTPNASLFNTAVVNVIQLTDPYSDSNYGYLTAPNSDTFAIAA